MARTVAAGRRERTGTLQAAFMAAACALRRRDFLYLCGIRAPRARYGRTGRRP
jgi:hypothetical protein